MLARFQREARLLHDELDHPNIVEVVHRDASSEDPYFVMPKADGLVAEEIAAGRWQQEPWVIDCFHQILEGMAYAHDKGVIHRDVKPANALRYGSKIKISDFGLGKALVAGTAGLTRTNVWSGTEPYMAPEQFKDMQNTGTEADVFSLGKLLVEMLTGDVPEVGKPDISELPERFQYFVDRCCAQKPENRFANAREALEAFERIIEDPLYAELTCRRPHAPG